MDELKPCAWCGAKWYALDDDGNYALHHEDECWLMHYTDTEYINIEQEKRIYRWNTRRNPGCKGCVHQYEPGAWHCVCCIRHNWKDLYEKEQVIK